MTSCYKSRTSSKCGFDRFDKVLTVLMSQKLSKYLSKLSKTSLKLSKFYQNSIKIGFGGVNMGTVNNSVYAVICDNTSRIHE